MAYKDVILADGPVSYWRLDEATGTSAADQTGANTGTYTGGFTLAQTGLLLGDRDAAVTLNGSTGYVLAKSGFVLAGAAAWSAEAWVKTSATTWGVVYGERAPTGNDLFKPLQVSDTTQGFKLGCTLRGDTGLLDDHYLGPALNDGKAHHIVTTWNGTTVTMYVDGASVGSFGSTFTNAFTDASSQSRIGSDTTGAQFLNGTVDEVAAYNLLLSPAQIANHYAAGLRAPDEFPQILPRNTLRRGVRNRGQISLFLQRAPKPAAATATVADLGTPTAAAVTAATTLVTAATFPTPPDPTATSTTSATALVTAQTFFTATAAAITSATAATTAASLLAPTAQAVTSATAAVTAISLLAPTAQAVTAATAALTAASLLVPTAQATTAATCTVFAPGAQDLGTPTAAAVTSATGGATAATFPTPPDPFAASSTSATATVTVPSSGGPPPQRPLTGVGL